MNEYQLLPDHLLQRASGWPAGEPAWRKEDIPEVIAAARTAGMVNLGGQPQFRGPTGTAEPYWLAYDPSPRRTGEQLEQYVDRSADETLSAFEQRCRDTDFLAESLAWNHLREAVAAGMNPLEHLWFLLYFEADEG